MTKVKVSVEGHYEVEKSTYSKHYKWVPAHALIECTCGQTMDVDAHHTTCPNCGIDHIDIVQEVAGRHLSEEEVLHPWHPDYEAWLRFKRANPEEWLNEVEKENRKLAEEE